jgi:hypothetical protein
MMISIPYPIYELPIPSTGKTVRMRPFLVEDERLLLMALKGDDKDIIETTKQVIKNCSIDGDVNIDKLPFFDIDYLFIALRAKSVGENIDIKFTCNNEVEGETCGHVFSAQIDVENVRVIKDDTLKNEITLPGNVKVKLKYPTYTQTKSILDDDSDIDKKIRLVIASIEMIIEGEKITTLKDITTQELTEFVLGLTQQHFKKFEAWVDGFPTFVVEAKATCDKCGHTHEWDYRNFTSFFV